jgi:hypothetical protein
MSNNLITSSMITNETLRILHNKIGLAGTIDRQYDDTFAKTGAKVGATINIRRPVQYTIRSGNTASYQDVNETTTPLTMGAPFGIDWAFNDVDLALSIDEFSARYLEPAAARLATELDMRVAAMYKQVPNLVGTPGAYPNTTAGATSLVLNAGAALDNNAAPRDDERFFLLNPAANAATVGALSGLFNPNSDIAKQYRSGMMGSALGFDFLMSQNIVNHTVGGLGGVPLVNGANQGTNNVGATDNPYAATTNLVTNGWTAAAANRLKAGDVVTIAGVYAVNPENKQNTGALKQFVLTSDVASDAGGNANLPLSPAIIAGGAYQNVTGLPANGAAITVQTGAANTAFAQNLAYHKSAFTLATVDMEIPKGVDMASRAASDGISVRFVRAYDITNNQRLCRFDILAGFVAQRPEWATRVTG